MDSQHFDAIARSLGRNGSRRSVLRTIGAAAIGAIGIASVGRSAGAKAAKVGICHRTGSTSHSYQYITVSENAVSAHLAHGDTVTNLTDTANCGSCGNACTAPEHATATCANATCGYTCDEGYASDGNGGCASIDSCGICPEFTYDQPACYWMSDGFQGSIFGCFYPTSYFGWDYDEAACHQVEGCWTGGCYKWDSKSC